MEGQVSPTGRTGVNVSFDLLLLDLCQFFAHVRVQQKLDALAPEILLLVVGVERTSWLGLISPSRDGD